MTLKEILEAVINNWGLSLAIILSLIEVSKIKINPWSWLFKWIGNILMSGVKKDIDNFDNKLTSIETDITSMRDESREYEAKAARNRILRCADEVYQGFRHSKEYFDNVLADITFYKSYCKQHPEFQNEITVLAVQRIEEVYKRCLTEHDFL